jgi:hypothetical protein
VAAQLVASRLVLSSIELISYMFRRIFDLILIPFFSSFISPLI